MSPIHDQSYRRYQGERRPVGHTWRVIAQDGIRQFLARRWFLALCLFAWVPTLVRMVQLYIVSNYPQAGQILPVTPEMFRDFLDQQGVFVFFMTVYVGAGLIANDRRANALQIYLSKPMLRMEYISGKLLVLVTFLLFVTLVPALMLLTMQVAFAGNTTFIKANLFLIPAIILSSLVTTTVASFTMLALSSMSKSSRFVGIMYAGVMFFTSALFNAMRGITGGSGLAWLAPTAALEQLGDAIFRLTPRYDLPVAAALGTVVVLIALSAVVLERRVRGVEVVT